MKRRMFEIRDYRESFSACQRHFWLFRLVADSKEGLGRDATPMWPANIDKTQTRERFRLSLWNRLGEDALGWEAAWIPAPQSHFYRMSFLSCKRDASYDIRYSLAVQGQIEERNYGVVIVE